MLFHHMTSMQPVTVADFDANLKMWRIHSHFEILCSLFSTNAPQLTLGYCHCSICFLHFLLQTLDSSPVFCFFPLFWDRMYFFFSRRIGWSPRLRWPAFGCSIAEVISSRINRTASNIWALWRGVEHLQWVFLPFICLFFLGVSDFESPYHG